MSTPRPPWSKERHEAPQTLDEHVRAYIEDHRLALTPLRANSKVPALLQWQDRGLLSVEQWDVLYNPALHGGVGLVHECSGTAAFDVDHAESMRLIFSEYGWDYEALLGAYPRIIGNPERAKILFRLPDGFAPEHTKIVLRWPDPTGECDAQGRAKLITVFELRAGQNQDVLPPSFHPDTHRPYTWADGQAPWDYGQIPTLPADHPLLIIWAQWDRFRDQLERISPAANRNARVVYGVEHPIVTQTRPSQGRDIIGQYNRSVSVADVLARNGYVRRGKRWLAPHSATKIPGVILLDSGKVFSHHGSDVLCTGHAHDAFSLLETLEHSGSTDSALAAACRELGIEQHPVEEIDYGAFVANTLAKQAQRKAPARPIAPPPSTEPLPQWLIDQAPGWLGETVRWGLETAHKPLPHLTLQAAIAAASVAASRRYRSNHNNWPSLWLLNIEVTASGKEHPESLIESVLDPAGLGGLIAGSGYTSPGAVYSTLLDRPAHIAILDEFGKLMESSQAKGMQHKADAISVLMQCFSACHRVVRPSAYSGMGLTREQREQLANRRVHNPGVVLYASTTPSTFYGSIDRRWIADGFLGRFLVCNSQVGRQLSQAASMAPPPEAVVDWVAAVGRRTVDADNLAAGIDTAADTPAIPIEMTFSPPAERLLASVEADIHARMDEAEQWGLESLYGRTREKAMRLAMLVCLAESAGNRTITDSHTQYAIDYVTAMDASLVETAKHSVSDSDFARVKTTCLSHIQAAGERGLTARELERKAAAFNALKPREQQEMLAALGNSGLIELRVQASASGRGRKRQAWVATQEEDSGQ